MRSVRLPACAVLLSLASCVYFNTMYDAERYYDEAVESRRAGDENDARVGYDSVIAMTERIVSRHADSKHAAPAAILKARSELARGERWEAAAATAASVPSLTDDRRLIGLAAGLEGIARRHLGEIAAAERLLTRGLESEPPPEDRALFLFHRGLTRLDAGATAAAAEDLEAASTQARLGPEVRLDLARGLSNVGRRGEAVRLTDDLVRESRYGNYSSAGMDPHLDSLARRAPRQLREAFTAQQAEEDLTRTRRALLAYYRALTLEVEGDAERALLLYDSARVEGDGRYAAEAAYRWSRLRLREARRPEDVAETRQALAAGRRVPEPEVSADAARLGAAVEEFIRLVDAYQTRGGTAAEAALRAAELAATELRARHLARGLYLRYLDLAPESPWRAKAIAGAMLHADSPAGDWAGDEGPATDARLRDQLAGLPAADPYRISIEELPRDADVDSAYVERERDLRRRIVEIRMLYDTTAVLVQPSDTADDAGEAEEVEQEREEPAGEVP